MEHEHRISFLSDGLNLSGVLSIPGGEGTSQAEPYPTIILLHGFGANKEDRVLQVIRKALLQLGYAVLRFDMRGCGESEGERARVLCEEQVRDTHHAVNWLLTRKDIDHERIAVLGHSFGAAIAVYAAAIDTRIAACISSAGWGDGATKLRQQHASEQAWARFNDMLDRGRIERRAGRSMRVSRFDIVPIPPSMRDGLPPGAFLDFPFEVVEQGNRVNGLSACLSIDF